MKVKTKGNKEEGLRNANLIAWVASQEALDLTSLAGRIFPFKLPSAPKHGIYLSMGGDT